MSVIKTLYYVAIIIHCGIMHFLCAMHVFNVQPSSSSRRLPLCQISFFATSIAELAHGKKSHTQSLNQSLTQLIRCPGNQSACALK